MDNPYDPVRRKVGVFHPGTQHSWQTALAFQEGNLLGWFATSVLYDGNRLPYSVTKYLPRSIGAKLDKEFKRRDFPPLDKSNVYQLGLLEWLAVPLRRARLKTLAQRVGSASSAAGARRISKLLSGNTVDALWTYDAVGLDALRFAKEAGVPTVLDQTIGHMASLQRVLQIESERHPEFFSEGSAFIPQSAIDIQIAETELADVIVVGSEFARSTLLENGVLPSKIHVLRYGFDERLFCDPVERSTPVSRPVEFLCVGTVGARKGTPYLLNAFRQLPPAKAHLTIIGPLDVPPSILPSDMSNVTFLPSVARSDIPRIMAGADCMILPSLFEGCSISLHEAIGSGLPIIHSTSAGDGLVDGNGIVLPEVSAESIYNAVELVLRDPSLIGKWSKRAIDLIPTHRSSAYRQRVREFSTQWLG